MSRIIKESPYNNSEWKNITNCSYCETVFEYGYDNLNYLPNLSLGHSLSNVVVVKCANKRCQYYIIIKDKYILNLMKQKNLNNIVGRKINNGKWINYYVDSLKKIKTYTIDDVFFQLYKYEESFLYAENYKQGYFYICWNKKLIDVTKYLTPVDKDLLWKNFKNSNKLYVATFNLRNLRYRVNNFICPVQ